MQLSETFIVDGTLWTLAAFSLLTWSVILIKGGETLLNQWRNRAFLQHCQRAPHALEHLAAGADSQAARVHQAGLTVLQRLPSAGPNEIQTYWHELLERRLRHQVQLERSPMDSGLGWLASIGSTSPFVGLFGTVWGIMHALKDISAKGSASLDVVAGPIGEALIATALGIVVAIPAVIAYNFFLRQNKRVIASLDQLASELLHAAMENHLIRPTGHDASAVPEHKSTCAMTGSPHPDPLPKGEGVQVAAVFTEMVHAHGNADSL
ncbi:MAG: MotA/TolQ/ExbB proton channel family protein [Methylococcaceae bacterium]|nr:MAG: MotA/TolQ/ExbB proton channel family protein [Methylococcaceae bacterium]